MKREGTIFALWVIFIFFLVEVIDFALYLIASLLFPALVLTGMSPETVKWLLMTTVSCIYPVAAYIVYSKSTAGMRMIARYKARFPVKTLAVLAVIVLLVQPMANQFYGTIYAHVMMDAEMDYLEGYGSIYGAFFISKWVTLAVITIVLLIRYKKLK